MAEVVIRLPKRTLPKIEPTGSPVLARSVMRFVPIFGATLVSPRPLQRVTSVDSPSPAPLQSPASLQSPFSVVHAEVGTVLQTQMGPILPRRGRVTLYGVVIDVYDQDTRDAGPVREIRLTQTPDAKLDPEREATIVKLCKALGARRQLPSEGKTLLFIGDPVPLVGPKPSVAASPR